MGLRYNVEGLGTGVAGWWKRKGKTMHARISFFVAALALSSVSAPAASAQLATGADADNLALGKQLLENNDLWGAKDHLEREQLANPGRPELKPLLDEVYGKLAQASLAGGQPSQALVFADKALAIRPNQTELVYAKARAHEELKDNDNAIANYEKAMALAGADFKGSQERLIYLYKVRGQGLVQRADLVAARADFLAVLKYAPRDADANYLLGYIAYRMQQYDQARGYLDVSVTEPRLQRLSQMYRGMVEAETKQWSPTVKWMREARQDETLRVQTDPYLAAAHYNLGVKALGEKKLDEADDNFQDVLRLDAKHKDALFNLGMTWDGKGDLDRSREYYLKVRQLQPGHRNVEIALADVDYRIAVGHFDAGRLEKGFELFKESASLDPARGEPHYYIGRIHRAWKEDPKALPAFEIAVARGAFVLESRFEAGEINFLKADWRQTIAYLEAVERTNAAYRSDKVKAYLREAWWKLAMEDVDGRRWADASQKLKQVLKYPPDLPETHYYLGLAALRQGFFDTAVAELEPAYKQLAKNPDVRKALAEAHYNLGLAAYSAQRYRDAEKEFTRAYQVEPGDLDIQYQMARTWNQLARFREAIPHLEKLAKREPSFRDSSDDLAEAYGGYGEQLLDQKKTKDARANFVKALDINPAAMRALYGMGAIAMLERRYDEGVKRLQPVYERNPEYRRTYPMLIEAYWQLGKAAYDKKQALEARRSFMRVVDLDPNHGEALYHLGDLEVNAKNYEDAKSYFERAINRRTKVVESHYGLGTVLFEQGNFEDAAENFEETSAKNPTYKNVDSYLRRSYYNAADGLMKVKKEIEAAVYYEKFFKLEPKNAQIALKLAEIAERNGLEKKAMDWYEAALPLIQGDADQVRFKLAMLAFKNQLYDRALNVVNKIKSPEGRELKGTIYLAVGRRDHQAGNLGGALANLKLALEVLPGNPEALFEVGLIRFEQENWADAAKFMRQAVDLKPALPDGKKKVAIAYRKLGAELFQKERLQQADEAYKTSDLYEESLESEYYVGVIAYLRKDLRTALTHFESVEIKNAKFEANANYLRDTVCELGKQAEKAANLGEAKAFLLKCSQYNPSDRDLRYRVAVLAFKQQEYVEARRRFRDLVLNAGKSYPDAKGYLVDSLFALQQKAYEESSYEQARMYAEEIVEQAPESVRALFALAQSYEQLGSLADAEKTVRKVLDARPGMSEAVDLLQRVQAARAAQQPVAAPK